MEAKKLKTKKGTINKGKIKKTLKNVICRPDPVFWPAVSEGEGTSLSNALMEHRISIPDFKKPHWDELKLIPKNKRPKPTPLKKIDGLLFGISVCRCAIEKKECSAVLIEALVEPQMIVQSIIEACNSSNIPVVCLKDLRIITKNYFGIQTSCLGIKKDNLVKISNSVKEIYQKYKLQKKNENEMKSANVNENKSTNVNLESNKVLEKDMQMDIDMDQSHNPYLFRTDKKTRVFVPSNKQTNGESLKFVGQNFIKFSGQKIENKTDSKEYMRLMLKKITNNPNRKKIK
ncbi:uncharacterized protein LOC124536642 [Vanessa cardui]|uniref:uncharacterized protein LOC124536642 n=1 Tax=Vanessa cardui TaxID=171605 RepID=UPI001F13A7D7|nr:uncharacterized protein LOC124536642 [Vanessa cardui]